MERMTEENKTIDSKRIAKNTLVLYMRMLVAMIIGLYTSRIIINALGFSDYGLYSVVGGVVSILIFVNSTLTSGTQRFLNFALGKGDDKKLKLTFSTALFLHLIIATFFVIFCETVGLWFLCNKINIPPGRENAAFWVFQLSTLSIFILTLFVPFTSAIIAHERFKVYAYMTFIEVTMNLIIALMIKAYRGDRLILYSSLIVFTNILTTFIYFLYCTKHFEECRFNFHYEKILLKEMTQFSGWNIMGCASVTLQNQGINILINIYFGTIANAARGIAVQVNQKVLQFVGGFQTAVNPQIVKLYAAGNIQELTRLVIGNSKFAAFLYLIIGVPICVEIDYILKIWLGEVPKVTSGLIYIIMFQTLVQTISRPVVMLVHAVGKMKMVNLTAGGCLLIILPVSLLLAHLGAGLETIFIVNVIPWFFETFFELYYEHKYCDFPICKFYRDVYLSVFPLAALMLAIPFGIKCILPFGGFLRLLIVTAVSLVSSSILILFVGLDKNQRDKVLEKVGSKLIQLKSWLGH